MVDLRLAPDAEPTPMTREGTRALVERFHGLKRERNGHPTQVGGGSPRLLGSGTSLPSPLSPDSKSYSADKIVCTFEGKFPAKKTKSEVEFTFGEMFFW
jgi:hypothetical protein